MTDVPPCERADLALIDSVRGDVASMIKSRGIDDESASDLTNFLDEMEDKVSVPIQN
jgi:hypothetical protein